jgi:hypothetical protein
MFVCVSNFSILTSRSLHCELTWAIRLLAATFVAPYRDPATRMMQQCYLCNNIISLLLWQDGATVAPYWHFTTGTIRSWSSYQFFVKSVSKISCLGPVTFRSCGKSNRQVDYLGSIYAEARKSTKSTRKRNLTSKKTCSVTWDILNDIKNIPQQFVRLSL